MCVLSSNCYGVVVLILTDTKLVCSTCTISKHNCPHVKTVKEAITISDENESSLLVTWKCILTDSGPCCRQESRVVTSDKSSKRTISFIPPNDYASCLKSSDRFYYDEGKCHLYSIGIDLICSKCGNLNDSQSTNVMLILLNVYVS